MKPTSPYQFLPFKTNTLRFKISILYVAVIGLVLILIQGVFYYKYTSSITDEYQTQLQNKAEQICGAINTFRIMLGGQKHAFSRAVDKAMNLNIEYPQYIFMPESPEKFWLAEAKKLGLERDYLIVMDRQGRIIGKTNNVNAGLMASLKEIKTIKFDRNMFYKAHVNNKSLLMITVPYFYNFRQGYVIAVASSYELIEQILWQHLLYVVVSTLIFLVIASLMVRIFVVRVLSSVKEISSTARTISQENLSARINLTHADEEIGHLTESLNDMIARLEKSFAHIKEFSLEMAHEVKTPLAIISGESQMALGKDCTPLEYKDTLNIILKEAQNLQGFVSDLLLLTKLDYRLIAMRFETIDLAQFLRDTCSELRAIHLLKGIKIQQDISQEPIFLKGDKIHLQRVFLI